jgi:8-oxo-dGTP diphosphatase
MGHPPFAVTADLVVLTLTGDELCALVVRRGVEPYLGGWALPGGFVRASWPRRRAWHRAPSTSNSSPATAHRTATRGCAW